MEIPVVVQHRHIHLSSEDTQTLFGREGLRPSRAIEQRDQFVAKGAVGVHGPKGSFSDVCVIGPERAQTQVELSASDAFAIGVDAPLRLSGDLERSATVLLKTEFGEVIAKMSTIIPLRHLHLPPTAAASLGVTHLDVVSVQMRGREDVLFDQVVVRVHPTFAPAFHLTKDEAAPYWIQTGDMALVSVVSNNTL